MRHAVIGSRDGAVIVRRAAVSGLLVVTQVVVFGAALASSPAFAAIAARIAASNGHSCAVTTAGGVKCWGENASGELGDGTTTIRATPVDVSGLTSGVTTVALGFAHACALTTSGGVKCWGLNLYGHLGDGTTTQRLEPGDVVGLTSGVADIVAGEDHTCALTTAGGVKCWGYNEHGTLGNGASMNIEPLPVDVVGLESGVAAITAGYYHSCALMIAGGVKCWGYNGLGALGDGTTTQQTTAVDVTGLTSGIAAIAAGGWHSCALSDGGGVKCWGNNGEGELGDGTRIQRAAPGDVSGLTSGVTAIASGADHVCAITADGGIRCWGQNAVGNLGTGLTQSRLSPVAANQLTEPATATAGGLMHRCALTAAGGVKCWGGNKSGQLGDGTTTGRLTPVEVVGLGSGMVAVSANASHACALTATGGVKCWGDNANGQLGDGTTTMRPTPVDVVGLASGVAAISTGMWHACALTATGGVKCWGQNAFGQLGDGTNVKHLTPADVSGLTSGVTAIASGAHTNCALTTAGGVKCWGYNLTGGVGDGSTTSRWTPVGVIGLSSGVASIGLGWGHSCAVTTAGAALCWGDNVFAQLGDGTTTRRSTPVGVTGLGSGVSAIDGGTLHTCAVTSGGGVKCWGDSGLGQVGDGTTVTRTSPVDVVGLGSGVTTIGAEWTHTCARMGAGGLQCWGLNYEGQLGNGEAAFETIPVATIGFGPACGNGTIEPTEQCDDGNTAGGDCCSSACQLESSATVCRAAHGSCDSAETCSGSSAICPADTFVTAGTACADDGNVCTDDACDGAGACAHVPNVAPCDDGAFCTGADTCAGGSCAVHAGDPCAGGAECAATCDELLDTCDASAGTSCTSDGNPCTLDACDGSGACSHPAGHAGTLCRAVAGDCDLAEACDGTSPVCPSDVLHSSSHACRVASGECDLAESCTGASAACPTDLFVTGGTACSADAQACTTDACDGAGQCVHEALPDSDGDATCDAQDACTNLGGGRLFVVKPKSKMVLAKIHTDAAPGNDTLALTATFALPAGEAFADLDPRTRGGRVTLHGAPGTAVVDALLPGGTYAGKGTRGWRSNGRRTVWQYLDKTSAPIGGITLLRAVDRGTSLPGGLVAVTVSGKRATYPLATVDVPLRATVTLGNQSDAIAGLLRRERLRDRRLRVQRTRQRADVRALE